MRNIKSPSKDVFHKALKDLEELNGEPLSAEQKRSIYYTLFQSHGEKGMIHVITKYASFYNYTPRKIDYELISDLFSRYGFTQLDLEKAFKGRIYHSIHAGSRVFPTPAELLAILRPRDVGTVFSTEDRIKASEDISASDIAYRDNMKIYKEHFHAK